MANYHHDRPILGTKVAPDLLNRTGFSYQLANILNLKEDDDCLTVSIEGRWGSGKTSIINLIKNQLSSINEEIIVVEYNPWLAGKPETLIQDFLLQFSTQLNIKSNSELALKAAKELIAYSSLFSVAKLIPGAEPWASIVGKVVSKVGDSAKQIAELKKLDLIGKKQKVNEAISKINLPIVVIIDDIDRLTPNETFQILRLVKAVADFKQTSFLLSYDPEYLTSVLSKNDIGNPSEYIDKIVQLRVQVPMASGRGLEKIFDSEFGRLEVEKKTKVFEGDFERLGWLYQRAFKHLMTTPREIHRFFNHFGFLLSQVEGQVCVADLFALSAIAIKASPIYEHIKSTPEAYVGQRISFDEVSFEEKSKAISDFAGDREQKYNGLSEVDKRYLKKLIEDVFPLISEDSFSMHHVDSEDAAGRIAEPKRLHVALHYTTPEGQVTDKQVKDFIYGEIERSSFLEHVLETDADDRFFELLMNHASVCQDHAFDVLKITGDMYLSSEKMKKQLDERLGFVTFDLLFQLEWLFKKVISLNSNKKKLICKLLSEKCLAPMGNYILININKKLKDNSEDDWIDGEDIDECYKLYEKVALSVLENNVLVGSSLRCRIFYGLGRVSQETARQYLAKLLSKPEEILLLLETIGYNGADSTNGQYANINSDYFRLLIDMGLLKNEVSKLDAEKQPIHIQAMIKSVVKGGKFYLKDASEYTC